MQARVHKHGQKSLFTEGQQLCDTFQASLLLSSCGKNEPYPAAYPQDNIYYWEISSMKEIFNRTSNPLFHLLCQITNEIYAGKKITKQEIQQRIKKIPAFQYNAAPEDKRELTIIDKLFHFESSNSPASICLSAPVPSLVTDTELSWLKSMLLDDNFDFLLPEDLRNKLINRLKDVTPLYNKSVWHGKPQSNPEIKPLLRTIINALSSKTVLIINKHQYIIPYRLEYDLATGLYSLIAWEQKSAEILKIPLNKNIDLFEASEKASPKISIQISTYLEQNKKQITLELTPTRNSVERCLFLFSTYDKETHIDNNEKYIFTIQYYTFDEEDILSKIQSLGASVVVRSPDNIRQKIKSKLLQMQNIYFQDAKGDSHGFTKNH